MEGNIEETDQETQKELIFAKKSKPPVLEAKEPDSLTKPPEGRDDCMANESDRRKRPDDEDQIWSNQRCPLCSVTRNNYRLLIRHFEDEHNGFSRDIYEQKLLETFGLFSCQLCFTTHRRNPYFFRKHLANRHDMGVPEYCKKFGDRSYQQSEAEEMASALLTRLKCPAEISNVGKCDREFSMMELRVHMRKEHGDSKTRRFQALLAMVSDQLGLAVCEGCDGVVTTNAETNERHKAVCANRLQGTLKRKPDRSKPAAEKKTKQCRMIPAKSRNLARRDEIHNRASSSKPAEKRTEDHSVFSFLALTCPICGKSELSTYYMKKHLDDRHGSHMIKDEYLERLVNEKGLVSCRLCGSVRRAQATDWNIHLAKAHKLDFAAYLKKTEGQQPLVRNEEEKTATSNFQNVKCPQCQKDGIKGYSEYREHLKSQHKIQATVAAGVVIGQVAKQLGLQRCELCLQAVLKSKIEDHAKHHQGKSKRAPRVKNADQESEQNNNDGSSNNADSTQRSLCSTDLSAPSGSSTRTDSISSVTSGSSVRTDYNHPILRGLLSKDVSASKSPRPIKRSADAAKVESLCPKEVRVKIPRLNESWDKVWGGDASPSRSSGGRQKDSSRKISAANADHNAHRDETEETGKSHEHSAGSGKCVDNKLVEALPNVREALVRLRMMYLRPRCSLCKSRHDSIEKLYEHVKTAHHQDAAGWESLAWRPNKQLRCGLCHQHLRADFDSLKSHLVTAHEGKAMDVGNYLAECGVRLVGSPDVDFPLLKISCYACGRGCVSATAFKAHFDTEHAAREMDTEFLILATKLSKAMHHACQLCDEKMEMSYEAVEKHVLQQHSNLKVTRFLGLFYPNIQSDWNELVFGQASVTLRPDEKKESATTAIDGGTVSNVQGPLDVIDLVSDDEDQEVEANKMDEEAKTDMDVEKTSLSEENESQIKDKTDEDADKEAQKGKEKPSEGGAMDNQDREPPRCVDTEELKRGKEREKEPQNADEEHSENDLGKDCQENKVKENQNPDNGKGKSPSMEVDRPNEEGREQEKEAEDKDEESNVEDLGRLKNCLQPDGNSSGTARASNNSNEPPTRSIPDYGTCTYTCPSCTMGGFGSLALATSHIERIHGGDVKSLIALKRSRVENYTSCKICGKQVVCDNVDLGYHLWTEHSIPLEAYNSM